MIRSCLPHILEIHKTMLLQMQIPKRINYRLIQSLHHSKVGIQAPTFGGETDDPFYVDVPKPCRRKSDRKPYPTPMKVLIRKAKEEKELRKAHPCCVLEHRPDNGLLIPELISVAYQVYQARESLLVGIPKLIQFIPVLRCRFCFEVHIGPVGHQIRTCNGPKSGLRRAMHVWRKGYVQDVIHFPKCYHIYDRVGKPRVVHNERYSVQRIPAVVELCIQAGVDLEKYPVRRRTKPAYCIEGRIVDFESDTELKVLGDSCKTSNINFPLHFDSGAEGKDVNENSKENPIQSLVQLSSESGEDLKSISNRVLKSWFEMISGVRKVMKKYTVWTCGYCPEVQVSPKGHKVRMCKASKHQSRDGLHAWQEATIDDLVGPSYVWHVQDPHGLPLDNNLKRYYGKAPAVVELCVQAGATVPDQYKSMMRLDVVAPDRDEVDLVA